jgi:medium-chain acyl-[acyl-carrier-protein] hydrolase
MEDRPAAGSLSAEDWVVVPWRAAAPPSAARLVCFPAAGGGASSFHAWRGELPSWIELVAVQLPGRENRLWEEPATDLPELIAILADVLDPLCDAGLPYALFGHSLGALLALELARELRRRCRPSPCCLIAAGREGPRIAERNPTLHTLSDADLLREIERRYGPLPADLREEPELLAQVTATLRADFVLAETYSYTPDSPLPYPILAYAGEDDPEVFPADLEAWAQETSAGFSVRRFPGGHFFLSESPAAVAAVTAAVADDLARAVRVAA